MTNALPALLAGSAVLCAGLPTAASVRLRVLTATRGGTGASVSRAAPPGSLLVASAAGGLLLAGLGLAVLTLVVAAALPRVHRARRRARDRTEEREHAVQACAALAAELRAGRPAGEALERAAEVARGPARGALSGAAAAARWGGDVPGALSAGAAASAVPEVLRGLGACWLVCTGAGSGLASAVERLADGLRARRAQERAVEAALAGARASAVLLSVLPLGGVALAAGLGAHPAHVLLHTPLGIGCLVTGVGLDALGLWWTGRLVSRAGGGR